MRTQKGIPLSGYSILLVYATHLSFEAVPPENLSDVPPDDEFGWDWRLISANEFEVRITVSVGASKDRPGAASTTVVGRFSSPGTPNVPVEQFVCLQAVAILLPYARQYLAAATVNSQLGAFHLPTVNVVELMKHFDPEKTTAARQLAEIAALPVRGRPEAQPTGTNPEAQRSPSAGKASSARGKSSTGSAKSR
jgi:preprotein translocase subunit SecB